MSYDELGDFVLEGFVYNSVLVVRFCVYDAQLISIEFSTRQVTLAGWRVIAIEF